MQIGKLIKMQMINKGIKKQEDLSTLSGVSVQVIRRILSSDDGKLSVAAKLVGSLGGELKVEFKKSNGNIKTCDGCKRQNNDNCHFILTGERCVDL